MEGSGEDGVGVMREAMQIEAQDLPVDFFLSRLEQALTTWHF